MYLKASEVKKAVHAQGYRLREGALEALNRQVGYLVSIAIKRCNQDRRKGLESQDFVIQAVIDIKNKWGLGE